MVGQKLAKHARNIKQVKPNCSLKKKFQRPENWSHAWCYCTYRRPAACYCLFFWKMAGYCRSATDRPVREHERERALEGLLLL